jgi:hypothetical protein
MLRDGHTEHMGSVNGDLWDESEELHLAGDAFDSMSHLRLTDLTREKKKPTTATRFEHSIKDPRA